LTDYADIDAMNWSTLKHLATSPLMLRYRVDHPREDTKALARGRAIHCALLEPERWTREYIVEPEWGGRKSNETKAKRAQWLCNTADGDFVAKPNFDRRTKKGKEAESEWEANVPAGATVVNGAEDAAFVLGEHCTVISAAEHELAERCANAVRAHPIASAWLESGRAEEIVQWTDEVTGLACKGRLDFITPMRVIDIKSTRMGSLRTITRSFTELLYHGQLAFYLDGALTAGLIPRDYELPGIIAVQTVEPYDVLPLFYSTEDLAEGRRLYRSLLQKYAEHCEADWWPGLSPGATQLELPVWAIRPEDVETGDDWG
jgi:hypothetical protein